MKNYTEYLPRDKHDFERVNQLKNLSREELVLLLPGLMEWVQDMNWPIAEEVSELLLTCPDEIIPLIKDVLVTNDDIWKYWCLIILVEKLPKDLIVQLKSGLIRLVESPTAGEKLEELDEIALEILHMIE